MILASTQSLPSLLAPEILLCGAACVLFLVGCVRGGGRMIAPALALLTLIGAMALQFFYNVDTAGKTANDVQDALRMTDISRYVRFLTTLVGAMLVLLAFPRKA